MPEILKRDFELWKRRQVHDIIVFAAAGGAVLSAKQLESFDGMAPRVDNPIAGNFSVPVLLELVPSINCGAGWTDDLNTEIRRTLHRLFAHEMHALPGKIKQVRTPDIVAAKDCVNV